MSKNSTIFIVIIVLLLLAVVGEYYYFHNKELKYSVNRPASGTMMTTGKNGKTSSGRPPMMMTEVTPPAVSQQQQNQLTAGVSTSTSEKTFNITGGNFYFVPNKITVNKGDKVTFIMTNAGGIHNLMIDELGVKTPTIQTGNAATVTFTASKTGSFVYYCAIPGHRQKGMWGTLTVQ